VLPRGWGFTGTAGRMVIEPHFDGAADFRHDLAAVWLDDKLGYIDRSGNFIWQPSKRPTGKYPVSPTGRTEDPAV